MAHLSETNKKMGRFQKNKFLEIQQLVKQTTYALLNFYRLFDDAYKELVDTITNLNKEILFILKNNEKRCRRFASFVSARLGL